MLEEFEQIGREAHAELGQVGTAEALEQFRIKYLGRKGAITGMLSRIGQLPADQRRQGGQLANRIKQEITAAFNERKASLGDTRKKKVAPLTDVTLPGESFDL